MTDELPAVPDRWAPFLPSLVAAALRVLQIAVSRLPLIALAALGSWAWQRRSTSHAQEA